MTQITWDQPGERTYETGVDQAVLYILDNGGAYDTGFGWNGIVNITESPSGAESTPQYADNVKYANIQSAEEFAATVEAFTWPDEFDQCDGSVSPQPGITVHQQGRAVFGLSYRTLLGNDIQGVDYGYKRHLVYGCLAAPSEKAYGTINESPELITFSWDVSTTPVPVTGLKPTSKLTINSKNVPPANLAALEQVIHGTVGVDPRLPLPDEVISILTGTLTEVLPVAPTYNSPTNTITIPSVTGVVYQINGATVAAGPVVISADTVVTAVPAPGYKFPLVSDDDWFFDWS